MKAHIDNTECAKDLTSITCKLIRHVESRHGQWFFDCEDTLYTGTFPGVQAGKSEWVNISFSLEEIAKDSQKQITKFKKEFKGEKMGAEELALEEFMTPTTIGRLFKCTYFM